MWAMAEGTYTEEGLTQLFGEVGTIVEVGTITLGNGHEVRKVRVRFKNRQRPYLLLAIDLERVPQAQE